MDTLQRHPVWRIIAERISLFKSSVLMVCWCSLFSCIITVIYLCSMNAPLEVLQKYFGYSSFRLEQEAIIHSVLQKKDTFVLMPTGGGKSLCYQIPALLFDGLTVVISPLIALMKDQVDALRVNGIAAAYLNSTQSYQEQNHIISAVRDKKIKLLYLAPESNFLKQIDSFDISLLAIDEAHCISHWGHDFRPEYLTLAQWKRNLPNIPVIALTATADKLTRKDILDKLELKQPNIFISSFNRANIRYTVEPKRRSFDKLLDFLQSRTDESGIIYCLSRAATESLAIDLQNVGYNALPYHAGLERNQRAKHQEMFLRDEVKIIVATIAFGMGIDKSNVRYVVHMDLPKNIESYYQETGRAGRDGLPSEALLLYSYGDVAKLKSFAQIEGNPEQTSISLRKLDQMAMYGDLSTCRRKYLLNYFDEEADVFCGNCDACLSKTERVDNTLDAQKLLSAVSRLQERFGAGYVIDFLRGSQAEKISAEHKELKTYGVGKDKSKEEWNQIVRDLAAQGYLAKSEGQYPVLKLTTKSIALLKGVERFTRMQVKEKATEQQRTEISYEASLFNELKALRRVLAEEEQIPADVILTDATLVELAAYLPHSKDDFRRISGFSELKISTYGQSFWEVVTRYCKIQGLTSRMHLKDLSTTTSKRTRTERPERETETKQQSFDLFNQGHNIDQIAVRRGLSPVTIEGHLAFYVQQGKIAIEQLMDVSHVPTIQKAIENSSGPALTPIKEALGDEYTFGEIKMVMAYLQFLKNNS